MRCHRLVGVTFGELSAWHASGDTRLLRGRIIDFPDSGDNGLPRLDVYAVRMLLRRLPPLSLDDEEGVLVVWLGQNHLQSDDQDSQLVRIAVSQVEGVIPLTARARRILAGRLEPSGIALQEAWFEEEFRIHSCGLRVESATRAGNELVKLFLPCFQEGLIDTNLGKSAALALALKDFDGVVPGSHEPSSVSESWVSSAFEWVRPAPYEYGALNHLLDAGGVLKKLHEKDQLVVNEVVLNQFRNVAKSMRDELGDRATLVTVLGDEKFVGAAKLLQAKAPDAVPSGLSVLVLFLRWSEHFHRAGSNIRLESVSADLVELQSSVNRADVVAALWLLGFYAGSERVMPLAYAAGGARYPWFHGTRLDVAPLSDQPHPRQDHVTPPQSIDEASRSVEIAPTEEANDEEEHSQHSQDSAALKRPEDDSLTREVATATGSVPSDENRPRSTAESEAPVVGRESGNERAGREAHKDSSAYALNHHLPFGERPWIKHRKDANAKFAALREVRALDPNLRGETLYKRIAREWFGYKREADASKFASDLKRIDQHASGS